VRAFVQLRHILSAHKGLAMRLDELDAGIEPKLSTHDQAIVGIFDTIRQFMTPSKPTRKPRMGFVRHE
jgi:hypothetical protein